MKLYTGLYLVIAIIVIALFPSFNSLSQQENLKPEIKIGGQIRYRAELDLRFFDYNAKALFINMLRTRVNAEAIISPNVRAFIQFQDSRNFGEENSRFWRGTLDGSGDNFDMHQGWIELKDLGLDNLTVKVGRMMFATNSERVIGNLEWHNFGRAFDGGWAAYKFDDWQARAFAFNLSSNELLMTSATAQTPKMLAGFDLNIPYIPAGNLYIYYDMNDKSIPSFAAGAPTSLPRLSRYTIGAFTKSDNPGFVWELEGALQTGTIDTLPRLANNRQNDISAWMVSAYAGYKESSFTIGGGLDAYSGDNPETDQFEGFDHLFITIHKFYGSMDFLPFTVLPGGGIRPAPEGTNKGILMPNIKASWQADSKWKFDASFMLFRTVEPYLFLGDNLHDFGKEIDLLASCTITKGVNAQFGSSLFFPGTILEKTNFSKGMGTDISYWGYTMLNIEF